MHRVRRWWPGGAGLAAMVALALLAAAGTWSSPARAATPPTPTARPTVAVTTTPTPTALATPDAADECVGCLPPMATTLSDLNVRRGPGVDYAILGYLRAGQTAALVGINPDGTWLQIVYPAAPDGQGWIARRYVEIGGDLASVPVVTVPAPDPTATSTSTPTPPPTETAAPAQPAVEATSGWLGEYFDNLSLQGPPVLVRIDPVIDFNWADRAPAPGMPADDFSVRWTRTVDFRAGTYRFVVEVDDGVRLWVGDRLIIDEWRDTRPATYATDLAMSAGPQLVRLEYYEHLANAMIRLSWHRPEDWRARYFDNRRLQGDPVLERWEEEINHDWGTGSPDPAVPADNLSARWTARVNFREDRYVFNAEVDDGVRLWVDGTLLIDSWLEGTRTLRAERYFGSRGDREVRVEYFERWGNARIRVWWERK